MVFIVVGAWLAFIAFYQILFPIMLLMGTSLTGYLCALLYNRIFIAIEGKDDSNAEPAEEDEK